MDDVDLPVRVTITEFDERAVQRVYTALDKCVAYDQKFLPVTIMSLGGDAYAMFGIIDLITHGPVPCATVAVGTAMSAGSILLASGHQGLRFVAPNATIMVHQMLASIPQAGISDVVAETRSAAAMNERVLAHLDKVTGKRRGFWGKKLGSLGHSDLTLTAAEAVKLGLADHVGLPVVRLEQTTNVTLTMPETAAARRSK